MIDNEIRTLHEKPRVLVAEDNEQMLRAITRLLDGRCDVVGVVRNGEDVIKAALELSPQIIVLDLLMPLLDGIQVVRQLRSAEASCRFVMVTGLEGQDFVTASLAVGADAYVIKRRLSPDLLKAMNAVLEGKRFVSQLGTGGGSGYTATPASRVFGRVVSVTPGCLSYFSRSFSRK